MIPSFRNKSYEESLARLNPFSLERRPLRGRIIDCFKILKGFMNVATNKLFSVHDLSRTTSNEIKLRYRHVELDCTKFFFTNGVVSKWNKLPASVAECNTINSFKINLTTISSNGASDKDYVTRSTASCLTM